MGQAVGLRLRQHGALVSTSLDRRSARTRALAAAAGIDDAGTVPELVMASEVVLSIVPPAQAVALAREVAEAMRATGARPTYVDCNAVAPSTMREIAAIVGGDVVDIGIIGAPPRGDAETRFYASGPQAAELELPGLDVRSIGAEIGTASALKMCYAALTKGFTALATELLVAAELQGVAEELAAEIDTSQPTQGEIMARQIPRVPSVAHRWIGEMEEIAKTFAELGLTPRILEGAAEMYRFAAASPLGAERPETRDRSRGMRETITALARAASASVGQR